MEESPSSEVSRFVASQEIPCILWNPKVHYCIHNFPPPVSILSQPNPIHTLTCPFLNIHPNIILSSTPGSPQWSLSLRFPHQNPIHASILPHLRYIHPSHSPQFYHLHNTGQGVQICFYNCLQCKWTSTFPEPHTSTTLDTDFLLQHSVLLRSIYTAAYYTKQRILFTGDVHYSTCVSAPQCHHEWHGTKIV
jgi:hypothetical protein